MNAYELADELHEDLQWIVTSNTDLPSRLASAINMLRQQADRITELEKQYDAMVMSFEARLATRGYEIQIKDQQDRIAELEKALDWIATVNAMDYEYQDVAKSLLKERHSIK